jgi:hypothetical protein
LQSNFKLSTPPKTKGKTLFHLQGVCHTSECLREL